jgi:alanyl-tRNA synthetase
MAEQRQRSRAAISKDDRRAAEFGRRAGFKTDFVGYEKIDVLTQIGALEELGDGLFLAKLRESPFYPAGGGQVTDEGVIERDDGSGLRADLREAYRLEDDQVLLFEGEGFAAGDRVRALVPWNVRFPTLANHTGTHLLHKALQEVLGDHVRQAGSAVRPDKLRFDFTHSQALTAQERAQIEERVNDKIFENLPVRAFITPIEEARRLGAMMLFGEKYGEHVRVVEIAGYSRELCGGTHVRSTAEIGAFAILSEGSVGAGARRIEAITSGAAYAYLHGGLREAEELRAELARVRKETKKAAPARAVAEVGVPEIQNVEGVSVIAQAVDGLTADALLDLSDQLKQKQAPAAVVLGTREDGKVHLVANFDNTVADRVSAADVVKAAAAIVGGGGGGRPTMARAGGTAPEKLPEALETARELIVTALR